LDFTTPLLRSAMTRETFWRLEEVRWKPEMGERQKWWYANEGLRISRFVADVEAQVEAAMESSVPPVAERVVTELGYTLFKAMLNPTQNLPFLSHQS
jgi:hypothetical protein